MLALLLAIPSLPVAAQGTITVGRTTSFLRSPDAGATVLGSLPPGTSLPAGPTQGNYRQVTITAWIFSASTESTNRDGFNLRVRVSGGENLRQSPNGAIIGRAVEGALFNQIESRGGWSRVTREVWVPVSALRGTGSAQVEPPADSTPQPAGLDRVTLAPGARLRLSQGGPEVASVLSETRAKAVEHAGEWVRVQVEGWVQSSELTEAEPAAGAVTLADLRANPERYVGNQVTWRLQFLALQTADALRPEMPEGQPYLLTRGPLPEIGFVYVLVPNDQLARFRAMAPLTEVVIDAVIRAGRTRYLPNPVVELTRVR